VVGAQQLHLVARVFDFCFSHIKTHGVRTSVSGFYPRSPHREPIAHSRVPAMCTARSLGPLFAIARRSGTALIVATSFEHSSALSALSMGLVPLKLLARERGVALTLG
jgi:hypothetical protein